MSAVVLEDTGAGSCCIEQENAMPPNFGYLDMMFLKYCFYRWNTVSFPHAFVET